MAWRGQRGMHISWSAQCGIKCFLEHICVGGRKVGALLPHLVTLRWLCTCLWEPCSTWWISLAVSNEKQVIQTKPESSKVRKGREEKGERKVGREAGKKKTYPDVRGKKPNLVPLSGCGNVLVPGCKTERVRPRLLPIHTESEVWTDFSWSPRPWLSSFCFVFHGAEQGVN